eukprot:355040-Chlamydomonas_euryale.AAC.5
MKCGWVEGAHQGRAGWASMSREGGLEQVLVWVEGAQVLCGGRVGPTVSEGADNRPRSRRQRLCRAERSRRSKQPPPVAAAVTAAVRHTLWQMSCATARASACGARGRGCRVEALCSSPRRRGS